jgi:ribosome small subunit-dependent GTPase A
MDLWQENDYNVFSDIQSIYEPMGYQVLAVSTLNTDSLAPLQALLHQKTSLFSGHSGVGKSSLINALIPDKALKVNAVSGWSGKGMHTTTFAEMHDLPVEGSIVDTPGIRELGLVDIQREELAGYMPDLRECAKNCKYNNCMHLNEPGCNVLMSVKTGQLSDKRYISYLKMLDTISEKHY